jgi:hypothetical protein
MTAKIDLSSSLNSDSSDSDIDDEKLASAAAANREYNTRGDRAPARTFVSREPSRYGSDDDDLITVEETPIEINYTLPDSIKTGSAAYWILEYEKALIRQQSITDKRERRAKVKEALLKEAFENTVEQVKASTRRDIEDAKREVQERIDGLKRQLEELRSEILLERTRKGRRRTGSTVGEDEDQAEDRIAELDKLILERKSATRRVLAVMREEAMAFGVHLKAETRAITAMQTKKRVAQPLKISIPELTSPEELNGFVAQVEAAYDTLF